MRVVNSHKNKYLLTINYDPTKDIKVRELEALKKKYIETKNLGIKKALLLKEREMLYEEYENPELTIARNADTICPFLQKMHVFSKEDIFKIIKILNINAIMRQENTLIGIFKESIDKKTYMEAISQEKIFSVLKDAWQSLKNTKHAEFVENCVDSIFTYIHSFTPFPKNLHTDFMDLLNNSKSETENYLDKLLKEFKTSKTNDIETITHVTNLLNNKDTDISVKQLATLAAGKFKSKENYEIIKKIAVDNTEPSPILRQNAIQSIALYFRENNEEITEILENIKQENSIFSPLARIILDKLNGIFHGKINRDIEYNFFNNSNPPSVKDKIHAILELDTKPNLQMINKIYSQIMPFIEIFKEKKVTITDDTVTKYYEDCVGERAFDLSYPNCGEFSDSIDCAANNKFSTVNIRKIQKDPLFTISHELGHCLNYLFEKFRPQRVLNRLYKQAVKNHQCLDYYAELSPSEYFAQGCEAYTSIYKPHRVLFYNFVYDCTCNHTCYELLENDPELYNFIKKMLAKYDLNLNSAVE